MNPRCPSPVRCILGRRSPSDCRAPAPTAAEIEESLRMGVLDALRVALQEPAVSRAAQVTATITVTTDQQARTTMPSDSTTAVPPKPAAQPPERPRIAAAPAPRIPTEAVPQPTDVAKIVHLPGLGPEGDGAVYLVIAPGEPQQIVGGGVSGAQVGAFLARWLGSV